MERLTHNHSDDTSELLSAYSDDAVDVVERRRAEQYLARCPACTQELRELRMLKEVLRDLPSVQPRRSFTIDPATMAPPRRLIFPTLRWASLVATLLLVVLLSVDVLNIQGGMSPEATTMQRQADRSTALEFAPQMASPDAASAPAQEMPAAAAMPEPTPAPPTGSGGDSAGIASIPEEQPAAANDDADSAGAESSPESSLKAPVPEALEETGAAQDTEDLADVPPGDGTDASASATLQAEAPARWSGLRIAQLISALAAAALGVAAWITWRRQV